MSNVEDERLVRRRARLARELVEEGVDFFATTSGTSYGQGQERGRSSEDEALSDMLLDELLYARQPPVHEGRRSSYGSIVLPHQDDPEPIPLNEAGIIEPIAGAEYAALRELANGISSFVIRRPEGAVLAFIDRADELSLVQLSGQFGGWIVQRHPRGSVRVFGRQRIFLWENDDWAVKPFAHSRYDQLAFAASTPNPIGASILDFCLHVLSARNIGSTLLWSPLNDFDYTAIAFGRRPRPTAASLALNDPAQAEAIATVLASVDGAAVISTSGAIVGLEAILTFSERARELVSTTGGTRHNSAARFSFDHPGLLVFVVSADGPVTVFSDGHDLLRLSGEAPPQGPIEEVIPELAGKISRELSYPTCGRCAKRLVVDLLHIEGVKEYSIEATPCPVCGERVVHTSSYTSCAVRVLKPWEGDGARGTTSW